VTIYILGFTIFMFALMGWQDEQDDVRDIIPWWGCIILSLLWPLALGCFAGKLARKGWERLR